MSDNLIRLYDGAGNCVTEFHPRFNEVKREIAFGAGYNSNPERRGSSGGLYRNAGTETWQRNRDRLRAMWDARDAAKFTWIGGVIGRLALYVCGRLHCKSDTGDPNLDGIYDNYFHSFCGDERGEDGMTLCDITGRHRFLKLIQMAYMEFIISGDCGFIEVDPQFSPTGGYCLQSIESDRIGSPMEAITNEGYIGGMSIDPETGRWISTRVFQRTRTMQYVKPREIEPKDFIHIFDAERSDEYRGTSKLIRCLNELRDIREWCEAEMLAGKIQSQYAAMVGTKDPFNNNGPAAWTGRTDSGTPSQMAEWGKILKMSEGESFNMMSPSSRPSGAFMSFIETKIRMMAHSLGLSFGMIWDLATLGGVSQRLEVQADLRKVQYWQQMLENVICNRVRNKVIAQGIAQQALPPTPGWKVCSWSWGPFLTSDLGYEAEADTSMCAHGIADVDAVISKHTGMSAGELYDKNAKTANKALMAGQNNALPVEAFASGQYPQITNQKAAFDSPPSPPPPPLSSQVIGDKALKDVLDLQIAVGDGKIDRDSAINTMVFKYGIPRAMAEKVIPDEPAEEDLNRAAGLTPEGKHAPVVAGAGKGLNNGKTNGKKPGKN